MPCNSSCMLYSCCAQHCSWDYGGHACRLGSIQCLHTGDRRSRSAGVVTLSISYMSLSLAVVEGAAPVTTSCFRALTRALKELPPLMSMRLRAAPPNTIFSYNTPKNAVKSHDLLLFLPASPFVCLSPKGCQSRWYKQPWSLINACGMQDSIVVLQHLSPVIACKFFCKVTSCFLLYHMPKHAYNQMVCMGVMIRRIRKTKASYCKALLCLPKQASVSTPDKHDELYDPSAAILLGRHA